MAKKKRGPADEPENDDPAAMPFELKFFDADDWPLADLLADLLVDHELAEAKQRRLWREARRVWLESHDYTDRARDELRTGSREYADAFRRARAWRY